MLVIDSFIPPEFQDQIMQRAVWNEDIGEWQIPGIAYTGNNMQKAALNMPGSRVCRRRRKKKMKNEK